MTERNGSFHTRPGVRRLPLAAGLAGALAAVLGPSAQGRAQDLPVAVLLRTHAGDGIEEGTARGFDRVLRQRLDSLGVVAIEGSVELDLEEVQLALGCIGESQACLRAVAEQAGATILVFSSIDSSADARIVSVQRFDARDGSLRRAVRTVDAEAAVLETAEPIARELWELPPITPPDDGAHEPLPVATPGLAPGPFVLVALGVAALAGGGASLGVGLADGGAYARLTREQVDTMSEVDAANALLSQAQAESLAGSVLLVGGGALVVAGVAWLLGAGREDGSSPLAVVPTFGPDGGGLVLCGAFGGGL